MKIFDPRDEEPVGMLLPLDLSLVSLEREPAGIDIKGTCFGRPVTLRLTPGEATAVMYGMRRLMYNPFCTTFTLTP